MTELSSSGTADALLERLTKELTPPSLTGLHLSASALVPKSTTGSAAEPVVLETIAQTVQWDVHMEWPAMNALRASLGLASRSFACTVGFGLAAGT